MFFRKNRTENTSALIRNLLESHFHPMPLDRLAAIERRFPVRVRADLQRAVDRTLADGTAVRRFTGVQKPYDHDGIDFAELTIADDSSYPAVAVPPQYEEVDIGSDEPVRCATTGLWLLEESGTRLALFLEPPSMMSRHSGIRFQVAAASDEVGQSAAARFFRRFEEAVHRSECYKGKVLSLEKGDEYRGTATGIKVHRLREIFRDQVILPGATLELLERNILRFVDQRERLRQFGLPTKKGLLFYGPPGTGKTHTIHYITSVLSGHTTLIVTAEQVGLLGEYMTLARLLQPSIVVIEDVDLIARDRATMRDGCEEVLLNKLLNEMDGLRPDADILFVLTTNRPEALEAALAGRPGRVDQAIEFPLPDDAGREKLIRLYAGGLSIEAATVQETVRRTETVSAAFLKELMRRAAQFHLERDGAGRLASEEIDAALDELLHAGGSLNRRVLGADQDRMTGFPVVGGQAY